MIIGLFEDAFLLSHRFNGEFELAAKAL